MLRVFILFAFLFLAVTSFAERAYEPVPGDPMLELWRWRMFPELNGLGAQCMGQGTDGTMWFGMIDGVRMYDGFYWHRPLAVTNTISLGTVYTICSRTNGTMYFGDGRGIAEFTDGEWSRVFPRSGMLVPTRKLVLAHDGALWAATSYGALRYQDHKWTIFTETNHTKALQLLARDNPLDIRLLPSELTRRGRTNNAPARRSDLTEVCEDPQGRVWLGTDGGEILCFNPQSAERTNAWFLYNEFDGIMTGRRPSILPLKNGEVWVTYEGSSAYLNRFDGLGWKATRMADMGAPDDSGNLYQTRDGVIWFSTRYVVCAYRNGQWQRYEKPALPIPTARNFMLESADGALWIGGTSTEIHRIEYETPHWRTLQDLNFQWESPAGVQWFLHRSGRVVVHEGDRWISYGPEDGVIDAPVTLLGTRTGDVWVAGSEGNTAATACFSKGKWTRFIHDEFSWGIEWRGVIEASDGSLWFSAAVDSSAPAKHRQGLLQYRDGVWLHHHQPGREFEKESTNDVSVILPATHRPEPIGKFMCVGESRDGRIWAGRNIVAYRDSQKWNLFTLPADSPFGVVETMFTSREKDLWMGTRQFGALRYDGQSWKQYQGKGSLVANTVRSFAQTSDGAIWAATDHNIVRFDGQTWSATLLPEFVNIGADEGNLKAASEALWINHFAADWPRRAWPKATPIDPKKCEFWTICHRFRGEAPLTMITAGIEKVSQPGNVSISWNGLERWREPEDTRLEFSFRLDNGDWSAFSPEHDHSFFTLKPGPHHFEVRSRDQHFNIDPRPATMDFVVLPPVWQQPWFIVLMAIFAVALGLLGARVVLEQNRLRGANCALAEEIADRQHAEDKIRMLNQELEERVAKRTAQLQQANKELEAFSYSVSHDLRAPLRSIDGFSRILLKEYAVKLDEEGKDNLQRVRSATQRMGRLIDDLLQLSKLSRGEMHRSTINLSRLAQTVADELKESDRERRVEFHIEPKLTTDADPHLLRTVLENLFGNAWKFTARTPLARIEFGRLMVDGEAAFYVRDNGVGFDMTYSHKLFGAFQRLHSVSDFHGTGIGLASVQRIIHRHGGRIWAEGKVGVGATFYFTVPNETNDYERENHPTGGGQSGRCETDAPCAQTE